VLNRRLSERRRPWCGNKDKFLASGLKKDKKLSRGALRRLPRCASLVLHINHAAGSSRLIRCDTILCFHWRRSSNGKKVKVPLTDPKAQRGGWGITLLFLDLGTRRGWVVSTTLLPLYPQETQGTHCIGGWLGPRIGLDGCEKSRQLYSFLTSALEGVGGQHHTPAALPPGNTRYPLYRRLVGPQDRCGRVRKISPALLFLDLGTRSGWVVSTTLLPLYPRKRQGTHCIGGWLGPRVGLDGCEKSRHHRSSILVTFSP
jgi:hypothetical protein